MVITAQAACSLALLDWVQSKLQRFQMENFSWLWIVIAALFGLCFFSMFFRGRRRHDMPESTSPARDGGLKAQGTEQRAASHCARPGATHERSTDGKL